MPGLDIEFTSGQQNALGTRLRLNRIVPGDDDIKIIQTNTIKVFQSFPHGIDAVAGDETHGKTF